MLQSSRAPPSGETVVCYCGSCPKATGEGGRGENGGEACGRERGRLAKDSRPSSGQKASFSILKIRDFSVTVGRRRGQAEGCFSFQRKKTACRCPSRVASCGFLRRKKGMPEVVLIDQTAMLLLESRGRERGSFISQA